jgi:4'-phosphopantetheinyl transferase
MVQTDSYSAFNVTDPFPQAVVNASPYGGAAAALLAIPDPSLIDIWLWRLSLPATALERLGRNLSPEERARAARFAARLHRDQFVAGRGYIREILGRYLHRGPRNVPIHCNAFGKPQLGNGSAGALHFNLSHSGSFAALAVSPAFDVGIDIEEMRPLEEPIADRFFSPAEADALRHISCEHSVRAFYRCWTSKEAFVKAHGAGLSLPLDSFDVSVDPDRPPALLSLAGDRIAARQWSFLALDLPDGLSGTVAALTVGNRVTLRYRDPAEILEAEA